MEYVNPEALQLQHFLKAAPNIKKQMKALQVLLKDIFDMMMIHRTM